MECFRGWGKGEPGEARGGGGGQHGWRGPTRAGGGRAGGASTGRGGTGGEGPGEGKLNGCIMHQVHTSMFKLVVYATKCGDNKSTKVNSLDLDLKGDTLG